MDENNGKKIKVFLVDDHPMVLEGIKAFLSSKAHIEIIGEAADGEEAISKIKILAPDIIFMDISMPALNGIETTRIIRDINPSVKVIILTMHDEKEYILQFLECGARGYVLKNTSPAEFIEAIEVVYRGEVYLSPSISKTVLEEYQKLCQLQNRLKSIVLSARELQILQFIYEGKTSKQIAELTFVSERTIEKTREKIMDKFGIHNSKALIKYALENNILKII